MSANDSSQLQPGQADQVVEHVPSAEQPVAPATVAPDGADKVYTGLAVECRRYGAQGRYVFGVNLGGAFVAIADRKLGQVDDDLLEVQRPGFKAWRAENAQREAEGKSPLPPL